MTKKKTIVRKEKRYDVHFLNCNGFCYRTRCNCPYSYVVEQRKLAKMFGESIKAEYTHTITHNYSCYL